MLNVSKVYNIDHLSLLFIFKALLVSLVSNFSL